MNECMRFGLLYSYKSIPRFGRFYTSDLARLSKSGLFKTLESTMMKTSHTHTHTMQAK